MDRSWPTYQCLRSGLSSIFSSSSLRTIRVLFLGFGCRSLGLSKPFLRLGVFFDVNMAWSRGRAAVAFQNHLPSKKNDQNLWKNGLKTLEPGPSSQLQTYVTIPCYMSPPRLCPKTFLQFLLRGHSDAFAGPGVPVQVGAEDPRSVHVGHLGWEAHVDGTGCWCCDVFDLEVSWQFGNHRLRLDPEQKLRSLTQPHFWAWKPTWNHLLLGFWASDVLIKLCKCRIFSEPKRCSGLRFRRFSGLISPEYWLDMVSNMF